MFTQNFRGDLKQRVRFGARRDQREVWQGDDFSSVRGDLEAVADATRHVDPQLHHQLEPDPGCEMKKRGRCGPRLDCFFSIFDFGVIGFQSPLPGYIYVVYIYPLPG